MEYMYIVWVLSSFKFDKIGSATTDIETAKSFAADFNKGKYKYILEMDVTAGKDVRKVSEVANEDEVVLPPGSTFTITKRQKPTKTDPFYHIYMTQTARGGAKLDLGERPTMASGGSFSDASSYEDESDESEMEQKIVLFIYDNPGDADPYDIITVDKNYMIEDLGTDAANEGWSEVSHALETDNFYAKTDELQLFLNPKTNKKSIPAPTAKPKKISLYMNVVADEGYMDFPVTDPSEVISYVPYDAEPGWSKVFLQGDEEVTLTYFGKTADIKDFLGVVAPIDDTESQSSESESGESKTDVDPGLDPADYPEGDHTTTVNSFLKLPASDSEDGPYNTTVELFPNEKVVVHVTDSLTKDYGRARIVFFGHTYYVPLAMVLGDPEQDVESELTESDDEDSFLILESGEHISIND